MAVDNAAVQLQDPVNLNEIYSQMTIENVIKTAKNNMSMTNRMKKKGNAKRRKSN
jgi:hypothetical protein